MDNPKLMAKLDGFTVKRYFPCASSIILDSKDIYVQPYEITIGIHTPEHLVFSLSLQKFMAREIPDFFGQAVLERQGFDLESISKAGNTFTLSRLTEAGSKIPYVFKSEALLTFIDNLIDLENELGGKLPFIPDNMIHYIPNNMDDLAIFLKKSQVVSTFIDNHSFDGLIKVGNRSLIVRGSRCGTYTFDYRLKDKAESLSAGGTYCLIQFLPELLSSRYCNKDRLFIPLNWVIKASLYKDSLKEIDRYAREYYTSYLDLTLINLGQSYHSASISKAKLSILKLISLDERLIGHVVVNDLLEISILENDCVPAVTLLPDAVDAYVSAFNQKRKDEAKNMTTPPSKEVLSINKDKVLTFFPDASNITISCYNSSGLIVSNLISDTEGIKSDYTIHPYGLILPVGLDDLSYFKEGLVLFVQNKSASFWGKSTLLRYAYGVTPDRLDNTKFSVVNSRYPSYVKTLTIAELFKFIGDLISYENAYQARFPGNTVPQLDAYESHFLGDTDELLAVLEEKKKIQYVLGDKRTLALGDTYFSVLGNGLQLSYTLHDGGSVVLSRKDTYKLICAMEVVKTSRYFLDGMLTIPVSWLIQAMDKPDVIECIDSIIAIHITDRNTPEIKEKLELILSLEPCLFGHIVLNDKGILTILDNPHVKSAHTVHLSTLNATSVQVIRNSILKKKEDNEMSRDPRLTEEMLLNLIKMGIEYSSGKNKLFYTDYSLSGSGVLTHYIQLNDGFFALFKTIQQSVYWDKTLPNPLRLPLNVLLEATGTFNAETFLGYVNTIIQNPHIMVSRLRRIEGISRTDAAVKDFHYLLVNEPCLVGHLVINDKLDITLLPSEALNMKVGYTMPYDQRDIANHLLYIRKMFLKGIERVSSGASTSEAKGAVQEENPDVVSLPMQVAKVTYSNTKFGVKLKLVGKANRALVNTVLPNSGNKIIQSALLILGPSLLMLLSEHLEDKDISPLLKTYISEAADFGQIDAVSEITQDSLLLAGHFIFTVLSDYVKAVGGKEATKLLTQDFVMDLLAKQLMPEATQVR